MGVYSNGKGLVLKTSVRKDFQVQILAHPLRIIIHIFILVIRTRNKEKQKKAQHEWYIKHKHLTLQRMKESKKRREEWLLEFKSMLTCQDCGLDGKEFPEAMSFHHIDSNIKDGGISELFFKRGYSKKKIIDESKKCIVLCENCHRKRHKNEYIPRICNCSSCKNKEKKRLWFNEEKKKYKCSECDESDSCCIDFHHISDKKINVSQAVKSGWSIKKIKEEMNKCIPLCANCHRKKHK